MSGGENWQVGDLALCIKDGWTASPDSAPGMPDEMPRKGEILTVADIAVFAGEVFLRFGPPRFSLQDCWHAPKFRRISPLTDSEHRQALAEIERVREVVS